MQVHLEVADDKELRKSVRDLIRGQVTSILAGEGLSEMVADAIEKRIGVKNHDFERLVNLSIDEIVRQKLTSKTTYFLEPNIYVRNAIIEIIENHVKDLVTKEFIEKITKNFIEKHLKTMLNDE